MIWAPDVTEENVVCDALPEVKVVRTFGFVGLPAINKYFIS
jgi:hypothetical protein